MIDLWRLLGLYRRQMGFIFLSLLIAVVATLANVALLSTSGWFITAMAAAGLAQQSMNYFTPAALIRFLAIIRTGGRYADRLVSHEATLRLLEETRGDLFASLVPLIPGAVPDLRSGDLAQHLKGDVDRLELVFLRLVTPLVVALVVAGGSVAVLAALSPYMGLAAGAAFVVVGFGLPMATAFLARRHGATVTAASARLREQLSDDVGGLGTLLVTGAWLHHRQERLAEMANLLDAEGKLVRISAFGTLAARSAGDWAMIAVLTLGLPLVQGGAMSGSQLALAVFLSLASFEVFGPIPAAFTGLVQTLASARRLFSLMDRKPVVSDPPQPAPMPSSFHLSLRGVSFTWPGAEAPALAHLDLELPQGQRLLLTGPSGAGKSTLLSLLLRFHNADHGTISIGGTDVRHMRLDDVRRCFSVVPQKPHIFAATIAENLRVAAPMANADDMWRALQLAGLEDLVRTLPSGLESFVGAGATKLSGGEMRRLAVARALLNPAPILILDEPFEGLDTINQYDLLQTIQEHRGDRTIILVSHGTSATLDSNWAVLTLGKGQ